MLPLWVSDRRDEQKDASLIRSVWEKAYSSEIWCKKASSPLQNNLGWGNINSDGIIVWDGLISLFPSFLPYLWGLISGEYIFPFLHVSVQRAVHHSNTPGLSSAPLFPHSEVSATTYLLGQWDNYWSWLAWHTLGSSSVFSPAIKRVAAACACVCVWSDGVQLCKQ